MALACVLFTTAAVLAAEDEQPQSLTQTITAELDGQIEMLREAAAKTADPCLSAKYIAISNKEVRDTFLRKVTAGYVFKSVSCPAIISVPEKKSVLFDFDCRPGTLCFIRPTFLVVVNLVTTQVESIVAPYTRSSLATSRLPLMFNDCDCGTVASDSMDDLIGMADSVLSGIECNTVFVQSCRNANRCHEAIRHLRQFKSNPSRATVKDLSDFIHSSSMNEKCMKKIVAEKESWDAFLVAIAVILAS